MLRITLLLVLSLFSWSAVSQESTALDFIKTTRCNSVRYTPIPLLGQENKYDSIVLFKEEILPKGEVRVANWSFSSAGLLTKFETRDVFNGVLYRSYQAGLIYDSLEKITEIKELRYSDLDSKAKRSKEFDKPDLQGDRTQWAYVYNDREELNRCKLINVIGTTKRRHFSRAYFFRDTIPLIYTPYNDSIIVQVEDDSRWPQDTIPKGQEIVVQTINEGDTLVEKEYLSFGCATSLGGPSYDEFHYIERTYRFEDKQPVEVWEEHCGDGESRVSHYRLEYNEDGLKTVYCDDKLLFRLVYYPSKE